MPVTWSVDPAARVMTAVASGVVTRDEIEGFFDDTTAADVAPFRKLFDGRAIVTVMTSDDMLALGVHMQGLHKPGGVLGPLAIVLPLELMELVRRVLGILAVAQRPMRVFTNLADAKEWLDQAGDEPPPTSAR